MRIVPYILLFQSLFAISSHGIQASGVRELYEDLFAQPQLNYSSESFSGEKSYRVNYTVFHFNGHQTKPPKIGAVVISPGRGEPSLKYTELAWDLMNQGFYPTYVIDHRGQGASERLVPGSSKGHAELWQQNVADFKTFVDQHVLPKEDGPTFLIAHSMGGLIAGHYLISERTDYFNAVFFTSPMIQLKLPYWENLVATSFAFGDGTAFAKSSGFEFDIEKLFDDDAFQKNTKTHSHGRWLAFRSVFEHFPDLGLGKATRSWVRTMIFAGKSLRKNSKLNEIPEPVYITKAATETRVVNEVIDSAFCDYIPQCESHLIEGSFHEPFIESDGIRNETIKVMIDFFVSHISNGTGV